MVVGMRLDEGAVEKCGDEVGREEVRRKGRKTVRAGESRRGWWASRVE